MNRSRLDVALFVVFSAICLWIGFSSAWDLRLAVLYASAIRELNPVDKAILSSGGAADLVLAKFCGTVLVLLLLSALYQFYRSFAWVSAVAVAVFQAVLLLFIHLA